MVVTLVGGRISGRTGRTDRSVGLRHEGVCTIKQEELGESRLEGSRLAVSAAFVPASPGGVEDHLVVVVQVGGAKQCGTDSEGGRFWTIV